MINTVAIVTCGRDSFVERAIRSFLGNAKSFGRDVSFLVADVSDNVAKRNEVKQVLRALKVELGISVRYFSEVEIGRYVSVLTEKGFSRKDAESLLLPGRSLGTPVGSFYNAIVLSSQASGVLVVSDNAIARTVRPACIDNTLRFMPDLTAHYPASNDPTSFWYYPTLEDALGHSAEINVLAEFERWLGKSSSECRISYGEKTKGVAFKDQKIVAVDAGEVGEIGVPTSEYCCFNDQDSANRLSESKGEHLYALRVSPRLCLSRGSYVSSRSIALSTCDDIPPFFPHESGVGGWGGEDCWGGIVGKMGRGCLAHVPFAMVHDEEGVVNSSDGLSVRDFFAGLLSSAPDGSSSDVLSAYLTTACQESRNPRKAQTLARMDYCLSRYGVLKGGSAWDRAVAFRNRFESDVSGEVPSSWKSAVLAFSGGIRIWNDVRASAKSFASKQIFLAIDP